MDKYNYVILGSDWDLYKFSYSDLYQFNNVQYIPGPYPPINSLKGLLYRIHFNPTINRLVKLPFKTAWNDSYFKHRFPVSKPFCFIVFMNWIKQDVGITTYLREKFPNAKLVCILQDLASTHPFYCNNLKKQFDLVLSFDPGDCATYGFIYHPLVYSSYHGKIKKMPYSDVYMLAKAKNRLNDIFKIYTILKDNNLKPNLLLAGVDIQDQKYKDEIYHGKPIFYGLGNLLFDHKSERHGPWNEGFMVSLRLDKQTLPQFELYPYTQCNERPSVIPMNEAERKIFAERIDKLNQIISNEDQLNTTFETWAQKTSRNFLVPFQPYCTRTAKRLFVHGLLPSFITRKKRYQILNYLNCEAHLDKLRTVVSKLK